MSKRRQLKEMRRQTLLDVVRYVELLDKLNWYISIREWADADAVEAEARQLMAQMQVTSMHYHALTNR